MSITLNIKDQYFNSAEYDFLNKNIHLSENICLLTMGGSRSYGTHTPESDYDLRGVATNSVNTILGTTPDWETFVEDKTDTTIYSFKKIIKLLISMNPNTCEILGTRDEDIIYMNNIGKMLRDNNNLFLSKRAIASFRGYANQQLSRMYNYYSKKSKDEIIKEENLLRSLNNKMLHFNDTYKNYKNGMINMYLLDDNLQNNKQEVVININIKEYPLRELHSLLNEFNSVLRDYEKCTINHRGRKSTVEKLSKHQMHLFRAYYMLLDILENEKIVTHREKEHDFLMSVRNGLFITDNGEVSKDLILELEKLEKRVEYAINNTSLSEEPNYTKINELVVDIHKQVVLNG